MPISDIIFTSDQLAQQHVMQAEKIKAEPGLTWGIGPVDSKIIPMRGGDIGIVLGRPGDGKTSVMCYHAARQANIITGDGKVAEDTIVYVTWEGTVDKIYAAMLSSKGNYSSTDYYWGRVEMERVQKTAIRGIMPITFIGFSTFRETNYKSITLEMILDAVEAISTGAGTPKRKVRALYMDYIQLIPVPGSSSRVDRTSEAMIQSKNVGMRLDIPVLAAAQASREVDGYKVKLARPGDGQWSSQIEQHVDYGFSIWRPIRTEPYDPRTPSTVDVWGRNIPLSPSLLLMRNWKQRGDDTGFWWPMYMQPQYLRLAEMELDTVDLNYE